MTGLMERQIFWFKDPANLFTKQTWLSFVPTDTQTVPEALNAVVRFTIYFASLLTLVTANTNYLLFIPAIMLATIFLVELFPTTQIIKETFATRSDLATPTASNPFMNPLLPDLTFVPTPDVTSAPVKESIMEAFAHPTMFMDTSDKFTLAQSSRQFFTRPSNDLGQFQDFLNKNNTSRKADSESYAMARGSLLG